MTKISETHTSARGKNRPIPAHFKAFNINILRYIQEPGPPLLLLLGSGIMQIAQVIAVLAKRAARGNQ
jgi:hypothetical protein